MSANVLKDMLAQEATALRAKADALDHMAGKLPANSPNAPTIEAERILNRHGFAVVEVEKFADAIHVVRMAIDGEHETAEEAEKLAELLTYLEQQFYSAKGYAS